MRRWNIWIGGLATIASLFSACVGQGTTISIGLNYCEPSGAVPSPQPTTGPFAAYYLRVSELLSPSRSYGFVNENGNLTHLANAVPFIITETGHLTTGRKYVSTGMPGVPQIFNASSTIGIISTEFSLRNGFLRWRNSAFSGGEAKFCIVGQALLVSFSGTFSTPCMLVGIKPILVRRYFESTTSGLSTGKAGSSQPTSQSITTKGSQVATVETSIGASSRSSLIITASNTNSISSLAVSSTALITEASSTTTTANKDTTAQSDNTATENHSNDSETTTPSSPSIDVIEIRFSIPVITLGQSTIDNTSSDNGLTDAAPNSIITTSAVEIMPTALFTTTTVTTPSAPDTKTVVLTDSIIKSASGSTSTGTSTTTATLSSTNCPILPLASSICPERDQMSISLATDRTCYGVLCSTTLIGTIITANSTSTKSLRACAGACSVYNIAIPYGCLGVNYLGSGVASGQNNCLLFDKITAEDTATSGIDSIKLLNLA